MKFIHLSDSHLGKYDRNLAERFRDNGNAVKQIFDFAIKEKVDFVVHSGDLFDSHRPNPDTIKQAIILLNKLKENNIPFIVTDGNHDMRRGIQQFSILDVLQEMGLLHFVTVKSTNEGDKLIKHELKNLGITIYGFGYIRGGNNEERLKKFASQITGENNIILVHIGITGSYYKSKYVDSIGGQELANTFARKYIYMGLGHYHDFAEQPSVRIYQVGSTERWTSGEKDKKHFFLVDYENKLLKVTKNEIDIRPWVMFDETFNNWDEAMRNLKNWVAANKNIKDQNPDRIKYNDKPIYYIRLRGQVKRNFISDEFFDVTDPLDGLIVVRKNEIQVSSYIKNIKDWESMDEDTISKEILKEYYSNIYGENAEKFVDLTMRIIEASDDVNLVEKDLKSPKVIKEKTEPMIEIYRDFAKNNPDCLNMQIIEEEKKEMSDKKGEKKTLSKKKSIRKQSKKKTTQKNEGLDLFIADKKKTKRKSKKSSDPDKMEAK